MTRPVVAIVTGFTKCHELLERSFTPLRGLKAKGVINRILYMTWNTQEIDTYAAPAARMPDVELVRVPQPEISGPSCRINVVYQIRNLEAALALVPEKDALIVKLRPDFIADEEFLRAKIVDFDTLCAPSNLGKQFGVSMPPPAFAAKVWIPWADANQPFFFEDAAFIGLKRDIEKLASRGAERHLDVITDRASGWFAHVARYGNVFAPSYPIFRRYMRDFRLFPADIEYRMVMIPALSEEAFFWYLLVANAWIMATNFHVDCGELDDLTFYTNEANPNADWSDFAKLKNGSPYDRVDMWRAGQKPGGVMPCAARAYARVVDDTWQYALFTQPVLTDLTPEDLRGVLRNLELYRHGIMANAENEFYRKLAGIYRTHWLERAVA
jgi:hypothetical protein